MTEKSRLAAEIDGKALDDEAARALWTEFSAHMDANKGDMAGFAKLKGWQSVAPEYRAGRAVLVAWSGAVPIKKSAPPQQPQKGGQKPPQKKGGQKPPQKKGGQQPPKKKGPPPQKKR